MYKNMNPTKVEKGNVSKFPYRNEHCSLKINLNDSS